MKNNNQNIAQGFVSVTLNGITYINNRRYGEWSDEDKIRWFDHLSNNETEAFVPHSVWKEIEAQVPPAISNRSRGIGIH